MEERITQILKTHCTENLIKSNGSKSLLELSIEAYNESEGDLKWYDCPVCKNKGFIASLEDGREVHRECDCLPMRQILRLQAESGLTNLLKKYTFDLYRTETKAQEYALLTAKEYVQKASGWLFIGGRPGTGKTHLCTAIVGKLLEKRIPCKYMLWRDESGRLKACVNDESYGQMIRPLKDTACLYIDDFLKGGVTQGDINLAFEILNHRYNAGMMTIISSERSIEEILKIDEAIGSRIYESGEVIEMNGGNCRL